MKCNVCGTIDDKDGRGPVQVSPVFKEGLCYECGKWGHIRFMIWRVFFPLRNIPATPGLGQ